MDDKDRESEIADLRQQRSTLEAERRALLYDCIRLADWVHEARKEFGNPFYYSHPNASDKGIANYTGNRSHEVSISLSDSRKPTLSDLSRVERELTGIKEQLRRLGAQSE
ncbi:MAG: hypothetical protein ACREPT_10870 [Rudaea sp.]